MLATCPECETEAYHGADNFETRGTEIRFQFKCRECDHIWWSEWYAPPEEDPQ